MRRIHPPVRNLAIAVLVLFGCDSGDKMVPERSIILADPRRLAAARPHLEAGAAAASAIIAGARRCESPVPAYPICEQGNGQVLLLASADYSGAGSRIDALLWTAGNRPPRAMTLWHVDSLGTSLGHGWYHVTAISHVD